MSGTKYLVDIELAVTGDLGMGKIQPKLDETEGKVKRIGSELSTLGSRFVGGFMGATETVGGILSMLGKAGVGAAIGGATYGVMSLNKELETTKISLAAVLNSNGLTDTIEGGVARASAWMSQLKRDAKELPGEFSDLITIVQSGAGAAFQAGLDERQFGDLAAQAMAAGKALSVDSAQAGRDLARLMGGSAGMDNMLGSRLGFTADNFNGLDKGTQIQKITEALDKFQPAIKIFGQTMDAQSSTLVDNAKTFIGAATTDLSTRVVGALTELNAWFDANQATVMMYANKASSILTAAWDDGRAFVEEWGPSIVSFAERFYDRFMAAWREAEPVVKTIAGYLKEALDNPETLGRLETILKLYIAAKAAGAADGLFGGVGKAAMGALGGTGLATSAKTALWAGGKLGSGMAVEAAGAVGGAGLGFSAMVGGVMAATLAAVGAAGYEVYSAQDKSRTIDAAGGGAYGYSARGRADVRRRPGGASYRSRWRRRRDTQRHHERMAARQQTADQGVRRKRLEPDPRRVP
jgi:hypothetical protein